MLLLYSSVAFRFKNTMQLHDATKNLTAIKWEVCLQLVFSSDNDGLDKRQSCRRSSLKAFLYVAFHFRTRRPYMLLSISRFRLPGTRTRPPVCQSPASPTNRCLATSSRCHHVTWLESASAAAACRRRQRLQHLRNVSFITTSRCRRKCHATYMN